VHGDFGVELPASLEVRRVHVETVADGRARVDGARLPVLGVQARPRLGDG
jgi:hypothetical protein